MLYFDDLAIWVKTQKGSIFRGVACGILVIITAVIWYKNLNAISSLDETIQVHTTTIAEKNYQLGQIETDITEWNQTDHLVTYDVKPVLNEVVNTQTGYCNIYSSMSSNEQLLNESLQQQAAMLDKFIAPGNDKSAWYTIENTLVSGPSYFWTYGNTQNSSELDVPCIMFCYQKDVNIWNVLAVATGTYNVTSETIDNITVHWTYPGVIYSKDVVMTPVANVLPEYCFGLKSYDKFQENWVKWHMIMEGKDPSTYNADETENTDEFQSPINQNTENQNDDTQNIDNQNIENQNDENNEQNENFENNLDNGENQESNDSNNDKSPSDRLNDTLNGKGGN